VNTAEQSIWDTPGDTPLIDPLRLVGVDHNAAKVDTREQISFQLDELDSLLVKLRADLGLREIVALSTCNRTEFYWVADSEPAVADFFDALGNKLAPATIEDLSYQYRGPAVAAHLFRVVSGLESMIVGETQIHHQVKRSYEIARHAGASQACFNVLFQKAFEVAKTVRSDATLKLSRASVPGAAVQLAQAVFDTLASASIVVVGTGDIAEVTLKEMRDAGARNVTALSRQPEARTAWADKNHIELGDLESLPGRLAGADIVVTCVGTDESVIAAAHIGRRDRPLLIFDLGVPRNVDPDVSEIEQVYLHNIDDLRGVANRNRARLQSEIERAEAIIDKALVAYVNECRAANAGTTIRDFRANAEAIATDEFQAVLTRLDHLSDKDKEEVRRLLSRVVGKIVHPPTEAMREASKRGDGHATILWARRILGLHKE